MEILSLDELTSILLQTNLRLPYFCVSKLFNLAFHNAVQIKVNQLKPIKYYMCDKLITIKYEFILAKGWGVRIKTKKQFRFFLFKYLLTNNLWIESKLIIKIRADSLITQYMQDDQIYIRTMPLPLEFITLLV
jgi:hypothetical protein